MSFSTLEFGERCPNHPPMKPRGVDTRCVIYSQVEPKGRGPGVPPPREVIEKPSSFAAPPPRSNRLSSRDDAIAMPPNRRGNEAIERMQRGPQPAPGPPLHEVFRSAAQSQPQLQQQMMQPTNPSSRPPNNAGFIPPTLQQQGQQQLPPRPNSASAFPVSAPPAQGLPPRSGSRPNSAGPQQQQWQSVAPTQQLSHQQVGSRPSSSGNVQPAQQQQQSKPKQDEEEARRKALDSDKIFASIDVNGNGMLSLAELDKAIVMLYPRFNNKPAIMRAYKSTDTNGNGFVSKKEFRSFLEYMEVFTKLWQQFSALDEDHDRRITKKELINDMPKADIPELKNKSAQELSDWFDKIDTNRGGFLLFDEFCHALVPQLMKNPTKSTTMQRHETAKKSAPVIDRPTAAQRLEAFNRVDFNGNGMLSLAELDKAVLELWPQFNNKPAIMRAYKACDENGSGFVSRKEFAFFLEYLVVYTNLFSQFQLIDTSGDRRLSMREFVEGTARLSIRPELNKVQREEWFKKMDKNGGGVLLFDEFCNELATEELKIARKAALETRSSGTSESSDPLTCWFCGQQRSQKNFPPHLIECKANQEKILAALPQALHFKLPAVKAPPVRPTQADVDDFNTRSRLVFQAYHHVGCPECARVVVMPQLAAHIRNHKLAPLRVKALSGSLSKHAVDVAFPKPKTFTAHEKLIDDLSEAGPLAFHRLRQALRKARIEGITLVDGGWLRFTMFEACSKPECVCIDDHVKAYAAERNNAGMSLQEIEERLLQPAPEGIQKMADRVVVLFFGDALPSVPMQTFRKLFYRPSPALLQVSEQKAIRGNLNRIHFKEALLDLAASQHYEPDSFNLVVESITGTTKR